MYLEKNVQQGKVKLNKIRKILLNPVQLETQYPGSTPGSSFETSKMGQLTAPYTIQYAYPIPYRTPFATCYVLFSTRLEVAHYGGLRNHATSLLRL